MIDPNDDLRREIEALKEENQKRVEAERLLLKLSKYQNENIREILVITTRIELAQGDTNERLDTIERKLDKLDEIAETQKQILDLLQKGD